MAEKYIAQNGTQLTTIIETLFPLLEEHASGYFDSIKKTSASTIELSKNGIALLTIFQSASSGNVTLKSGGTSDSVQCAAYALYAMYVCTSGIAFSFIGKSGGNEQPFGLVITKDNNGETVILAEKTLVPEGSVLSASAASENVYKTEITPNNAPHAALCPFMVNDPNEVVYTPDAGFFVYRKYTEPCDVLVGGVKYFSNGLWALKDEEV